MGEEKRDRGFKTIYCGSQVPQYSAFFGFDFAGGGLGYFDMKVYRSSRPRPRNWQGTQAAFLISAFGARNQEILEAMDQFDSFGRVGINEKLTSLTTTRKIEV